MLPLLYWLMSAYYTLTAKDKSEAVGLFLCHFVTPVPQVRGRVDRSQNCLSPPHTFCGCPKAGTCNLMNVFAFIFY